LVLVLPAPPPPPTIASVVLTLTQVTIPKGQTVLLGATLEDSIGRPLAGTVIWSASPTSIATVASSGVSTGLVTAVGAGTATITATSLNGKIGSCTVIVPQSVPRVALLTIVPPLDTLMVGQSVQRMASTFDSAGN